MLELDLDFMGVRFFWSKKGAHFDWTNLEVEHDLMTRLLRATVQGHLHRQKRRILYYWDCITYLEQADLPRELAGTQETALAFELIAALGANRLRDKSVRELIELSWFDAVSTTLMYHPGTPAPGTPAPETPAPGDSGSVHDPVVSRAQPSLVRLDEDGALRVRRPCFYRLHRMDLTAIGMEPHRIDWHRLIVMAALIQLRADLEIYYETGHLRIRKCQRRVCGGWFIADRMAARPRFCSANCRAANPREIPAPGTTPGTKAKTTKRKKKKKRTRRTK